MIGKMESLAVKLTLTIMSTGRKMKNMRYGKALNRRISALVCCQARASLLVGNLGVTLQRG